MKYRSEIDGLRAVAVVPVIFFHAGFEQFGGGYVGVDVFFVISGFLITGIILADLDAGKFSLANFYDRRIRRILPAMFLVMLVCLPFAWLWILPRDMAEFSRSLAAVSVFSSNILFWRETGYFDTAAELKPLLHTWSLAVEEQFYVLFPIFLLVTWRFCKRWVVPLLATMAIASLAVAHWGAFNYPAATYFLLPTRGWELAIGSLLAFYFWKRPMAERNPAVDQVLSVVGVALIAYSVFAFSGATPFPSVYALVPTLGTALLILFAWPHTVVGTILGGRLLVGIGLISYSAYLWHQPLFAFARHRSLTEPSTAMLLGLSGATFLLAYLSWKLVEQPFRKRGLIDRSRIFMFALIGCVLFLVIGLAGHFTGGFIGIRYSKPLTENQMSFLTEHLEPLSLNDDGDCHFRSTTLDEETIDRFLDCHSRHGKGLVIVGDSHGSNLYQAITYNSERPFIFGLTRGGCNVHTAGDYCYFEDFKEFVHAHGEKIAQVLHTEAGFFLVTDHNDNPGSRVFFRKRKIPVYPPNQYFVAQVADYLEEIGKHAPVVWLGPRIEPHLNVARLAKMSIRCEQREVRLNRSIYETFSGLDAFIAAKVEERENVSFASQIEALDFHPRTDLYDCDNIYWRDGDHWTEAGEQRFGHRLASHLEAWLE